MGIDLTGLSRKELLVLQSDVETALREAEERERNDALEAVKKAAADHGFPLDELLKGVSGGKKRAKSSAKYRNPENQEQTWSGRGRKPQWVHDALARGFDITALEI